MSYIYNLPIEIPDDSIVDTISQDGVYTKELRIKITLKPSKNYVKLSDFIGDLAYNRYMESIKQQLTPGLTILVNDDLLEYDGHGWTLKNA